MKHVHKDLDYEKFVHIFNNEGKKAAKEFVMNTTEVKYDYFVRLLKKHTKYIYNRPLKRYELPTDDSGAFMSIDDLLNKGKEDATKVVASIPEKVYYKDPIDTLSIDILQDRLIELSKYIKISQSIKTIEINMSRLRESGYDLSVIN
ncbi:hypothetical protein GNF51_14115 [Clostridium perfringens]|uniref:hypothetical protein n=1 Tax=Clostridium perfringens TaxID=1502 RepID=UPI002AC43C40|nr:hypothetical protein [Clostridium perfringens]MDZ4956915.1 hypothetical protein [Clostridium perfringens]